ncbi:MAG: ABC transporter permease [Bacilli bacterium]
MIVFKNYFKIVSKHLGLIIMYSLISIIVSVMNSTFNDNNEYYVPTNPTLAIINYDNSYLIDNFVSYMKKNTDIIEIENTKEKIQDALYSGKVNTILIIPKDYFKNFLLGNDPKIEIKESAENASVYVKLLTNRYFKIANIYNSLGMTEKDIIDNTNVDLQKEIDIKISSENKTSKTEEIAIFYNYENYAFLSIIIFVIGTIMCIFNSDKIKKRNLISSYTYKKFNRELFLGHVSLSLSLLLIFTIISIFIYGKNMFTFNGLFMILNSFIFTITVTAMAYLIGGLIKNKNVITGIINIIGLGLSFISGCFVPLSFLDKKIISFAKLFPSYWFISNNNYIASLSTLNTEAIEIIFKNLIVIIIMGITYLILSKIIGLKNRKF